MKTREIEISDLKNGDMFRAPDGQRRTFDSVLHAQDGLIEFQVTSGAIFVMKKTDKLTIMSSDERDSNDPWA